MLAVPLLNVVETMRPLPIESFPGTSSFILGVSTIRGEVVPVIDVGCLTRAGADRFDPHSGRPARFVTIAFDRRTVALAVDAVIGVQTLDVETLQDLPPLLDCVDRDLFAAIGTLDAELVVVLDTAHLVPASLWAALNESANEQVTAF